MSESYTKTYSGDVYDDSKDGEFDAVVIRFLKELEGPGDAREVLSRYCKDYPPMAGEFRALAGARQVLVMSEPVADDRAEHNGRLGHFRIIREIARGGMGAIYEAVQEPFERRVVVKTIRGDRRHISAGARERFFREQEVLARLHHTHIVPIHAGGQDGDLEYFAMPYVEGAALHHVVRSVWHHSTTKPSEETPSLSELAQGASCGSPVPAAGDPSAETTPVKSSSDGRPARDQAKLTLSAKYICSVAKVMADAGDALHYAHQAGVIHRDVKPSNIMVDTHEHCWVLDFGLAAYQTARNGEVQPVDPGGSIAGAASGVMGTPRYMAPEQFQERADVRTDVWGLGVTLYELLALRPAFASRDQIESSELHRPREFVGKLPRDLEAICLKALRKEPGQRYATAGEFADDLRRWLAQEPVRARRTRTLRRVGLWAKRNKGWAAAIVLSLASLLALGVGGLAFALEQRRVALEQRRESLKQRTFRMLTQAPRRIGWSTEVWDRISESARIRRDGDVQSQAIASLAGLDARAIKKFDYTAASLAFDPGGKQLLMAGWQEPPSGDKTSGGIWDSVTDAFQPTRRAGLGLVAYRGDGAPLQLSEFADDPATLLLGDVAKDHDLGRFRPAVDGPARVIASSMTPDGSVVASLVDASNGLATITVWDAATSQTKIRKTIKHRPGEIDFVIELSPDGTLLAVSDPGGTITVWSLATGETVATLSTGRLHILCMAFGRDRHRRERSLGPATGWRLAGGDEGGNVTSWDLATEQPSAFFTGSRYQVDCVAFSPDGVTLATGGHGAARLWDVSTGRLLLELHQRQWISAVAFSPDGGRLAVSHRPVYGDAAGVTVYELDEGRGIQTLRGHPSLVEKVIFSRDHRLAAALTVDWRVSVWDRQSGQLKHEVEVPRGFFADNAGMAFSPDNRRFAFSTATQAKLWDLESGRVLKEWNLPPALGDTLIYTDPDRLILIRAETKDGKTRPYGRPTTGNPIIVRMRNLLAGAPLTPLREFTDFHRGLKRLRAAPDGSSFIVAGWGGTTEKPAVIANAYDGSGAPLGPMPRVEFPEQPSFDYDATGTALSYASPSRSWILAMPSLRALDRPEQGLDWEWNLDQSRLVVVDRTRRRALATFRSEYTADYFQPWRFSSDGRYILGTTGTGEVVVADLVKIQRRLAELEMGW